MGSHSLVKSFNKVLMGTLWGSTVPHTGENLRGNRRSQSLRGNVLRFWRDTSKNWAERGGGKFSFTVTNMQNEVYAIEMWQYHTESTCINPTISTETKHSLDLLG